MSIIKISHWAWGIGHGALGIGHRASAKQGMGHWALGIGNRAVGHGAWGIGHGPAQVIGDWRNRALGIGQTRHWSLVVGY
ncbi:MULTISPECIES: hypothetical protein [unclassified Microcoleus]|uniref:hypothetical protein n=1 Tax=unclassified Microcoleus TaxID=2642155 RepID=UPI002FCEBB8E